MARVNAILRFLLILLCLVPFASTRQASGAFASCTPVVPSAPVSEEDDECELVNGKERLVSQARHRPPVCRQVKLLPRLYAAHTSPVGPHLTTPFDVDPFRNGLGTPYRC